MKMTWLGTWEVRLGQGFKGTLFVFVGLPVSSWTKPSLHHHPCYKMFINLEPRHSVSSRAGSFTKWLP